MKRRYWTYEESQLLRRNQNKRVPIAVSAKQLERSVRAVASYASDRGFLQPKWTREDTRKALEMQANGHTSREIGLAVGKPAATVRKMFWRRRHGKV